MEVGKFPKFIKSKQFAWYKLFLGVEYGFKEITNVANTIFIYMIISKINFQYNEIIT